MQICRSIGSMAAWHHEEGADVKWLQKYGFPEDIRLEALRQIRILWAYESTGIEGNTLVNRPGFPGGWFA